MGGGAVEAEQLAEIWDVADFLNSAHLKYVSCQGTTLKPSTPQQTFLGWGLFHSLCSYMFDREPKHLSTMIPPFRGMLCLAPGFEEVSR
jgi:hypothetical protein